MEGRLSSRPSTAAEKPPLRRTRCNLDNLRPADASCVQAGHTRGVQGDQLGLPTLIVRRRGLSAPLFLLVVATMNFPALSLLLPVALLLLAGCKPAAGPAQAAAMPPVPVQTAVSRQRDVSRVIESVGAVQALRTVSVKSQVDGMIAQIHFKEGDQVKAGAPLVSLDRRPFENSLRIARADLANAVAEATKATNDVDRYQRLDQQEAISKEQFAQLNTKAETTKALVQAKEAAVANAELLLGYTQIRAPIDGRTGQLILHEGALVKANDVNQSIVSLNQIAPIAAAFAVPESMLNEIRAALAEDRATVSVSDRTSGVVRTDGKLSFVDNAVDPTTGTIVLKAVFDNTDHLLWPGQFVQVQTKVGVDRAALVVPAAAVQTSQIGSMVYVVGADQKVELRPVKVLRSAGDELLISEGLRPGETVVTDGHLRLVPGARVEAKTLTSAVNPPKPAGEPKP
ncbi:MAG: efflux RND transporter periplasmic adaptor subunit [Opitutus sp.]|nr:efflux RND transporter periplasmic adaptor subunit [Opitutus sp.]